MSHGRGKDRTQTGCRQHRPGQNPWKLLHWSVPKWGIEEQCESRWFIRPEQDGCCSRGRHLGDTPFPIQRLRSVIKSAQQVPGSIINGDFELRLYWEEGGLSWTMEKVGDVAGFVSGAFCMEIRVLRWVEPVTLALWTGEAHWKTHSVVPSRQHPTRTFLLPQWPPNTLLPPPPPLCYPLSSQSGPLFRHWLYVFECFTSPIDFFLLYLHIQQHLIQRFVQMWTRPLNT